MGVISPFVTGFALIRGRIVLSTLIFFFSFGNKCSLKHIIAQVIGLKIARTIYSLTHNFRNLHAEAQSEVLEYVQ